MVYYHDYYREFNEWLVLQMGPKEDHSIHLNADTVKEIDANEGVMAANVHAINQKMLDPHRLFRNKMLRLFKLCMNNKLPPLIVTFYILSNSDVEKTVKYFD